MNFKYDEVALKRIRARTDLARELVYAKRDLVDALGTAASIEELTKLFNKVSQLMVQQQLFLKSN